MTRPDEGAVRPSSRRALRDQERRSQRRLVVPSVPVPRLGRVAKGAGEFPGIESTPQTDAPARRMSAKAAVRPLMSMGAMLGVTAMLLSTSFSGLTRTGVDPAEASQPLAADVAQSEIQSLNVAASASTQALEVVRDSYTAEAYVPPVRWVAQSYGQASANFSYTNNPSGSIQWPFPLPAPISYGFGPRAACSYCSSFHLGVDFLPGAGVPIQAITEGVVSAVNLDRGGLGNHVIVDHVVNGQRIQSVYAHMAHGSIQVAVGQPVSVGTILGAVGSTGASTGAHLHLEIHADGTPIDPFAWLKANAN